VDCRREAIRLPQEMKPKRLFVDGAMAFVTSALE
jgi:hypothetical protein